MVASREAAAAAASALERRRRRRGGTGADSKLLGGTAPSSSAVAGEWRGEERWAARDSAVQPSRLGWLPRRRGLLSDAARLLQAGGALPRRSLRRHLAAAGEFRLQPAAGHPLALH